MKRPLCIFCLAVSAAACLISPFIKNNIRSFEEYSGSAITLSGKVYELESYKSSYSDGFNIYLEDVSIQDPEPDTGNKKDMRHCKRVIVYLKSEYGSGPENVMPCHIGQRITVCGKLKAFEKATNEGMFDALLYYNTLGISFGVKDGQITERTMRYDVVKDMLNDRRQRMAMILDEMLPAEDAGIMKTMLLGLRKEMDKEQKSLYRRSGIAHVLCISGLHISILGMGIFRLLKKTPIGIKASAVTAFFAVLGYVLMTGLGASSVRALVMFGFSMLAVLIGRTYDMMTSVSFIGCVLLLTNPLLIMNSGFVFSFGCVSGIGLFMPTLSSDRVSENGRRIPSALKGLLCSLTMSVITLPICLLFYSQFPVYSFLLNAAVVPVMGILVFLGFVTITCYGAIPLLSGPASFGVSGILAIFKVLADFGDRLPFHFYTPGRPHILQVLCYAAILGYAAVKRRELSIYKRWLLCLVALPVLLIRFNGGCRIYFNDVGQGDGIFIRYCASPICMGGYTGDFTCLVDGGSTGIKEVGKYRLLPFLKSRGCSSLDAVILTHLDADHTSGVIEILKDGAKEGIYVEKLYLPYPCVLYDREKYEEITKIAADAGVKVLLLKDGDALSVGEFRMEVLSPFEDIEYKEPNEMSVVLSISCNDRKVLLTGDIQGDAEDILARRMGSNDHVSLLKVAHHGSNSSSSDAFLDKVSPRIAVISVGRNNPYKHPSEDVLWRLRERGVRIYRTDMDGMITVLLGKKEIKISSFLCRHD